MNRRLRNGMELRSYHYEWTWTEGGTCYICGRLYPPWALGDTKRIGLVRFRKENHMTSPVLVCRTCLRRSAHLAVELKVFDINQELLSDEDEASE